MDERERQRRIKLLRAKRKRKRQIQRMIILSGLFLLIILCGIGFIKIVGHFLKNTTREVLSQDVDSDNQKSNATSDKNQNQESLDKPDMISFTESDSIDEKETAITISLAGDCTLGQDESQYGNTFPAKYNEVNDPAYFFAGVQSAFANDDLTIVNFEGTLTESTTRAEKTFAFKGDPSYVNILTQGSVEAVNLANNHSHDYGDQSFTDTKTYLDQANITHFGYEETAVIDVKGVKIGLVGIYELAKGIECKTQLIENLQKVKSEGAVITIVNFHWGTEKQYYPDDVQKELAHTAIDNGADLVVGHHPHVLQGIETYNGKKIAYSLGNFCFGGNKNPGDKDTMIYQQTFIVKGNQLQNVENVNMIPCSLSSVSSTNDYQPRILEGSEAKRVLDKITEISAGL